MNEAQNVSFVAEEANRKMWLRSVAMVADEHFMPKITRCSCPDCAGGHLQPLSLSPHSNSCLHTFEALCEL